MSFPIAALPAPSHVHALAQAIPKVQEKNKCTEDFKQLMETYQVIAGVISECERPESFTPAKKREYKKCLRSIQRVLTRIDPDVGVQVAPYCHHRVRSATKVEGLQRRFKEIEPILVRAGDILQGKLEALQAELKDVPKQLLLSAERLAPAGIQKLQEFVDRLTSENNDDLNKEIGRWLTENYSRVFDGLCRNPQFMDDYQKRVLKALENLDAKLSQVQGKSETLSNLLRLVRRCMPKQFQHLVQNIRNEILTYSRRNLYENVDTNAKQRRIFLKELREFFDNKLEVYIPFLARWINRGIDLSDISDNKYTCFDDAQLSREELWALAPHLTYVGLPEIPEILKKGDSLEQFLTLCKQVEEININANAFKSEDYKDNRIPREKKEKIYSEEMVKRFGSKVKCLILDSEFVAGPYALDDHYHDFLPKFENLERLLCNDVKMDVFPSMPKLRFLDMTSTSIGAFTKFDELRELGISKTVRMPEVTSIFFPQLRRLRYGESVEGMSINELGSLEQLSIWQLPSELFKSGIFNAGVFPKLRRIALNINVSESVFRKFNELGLNPNALSFYIDKTIRENLEEIDTNLILFGRHFPRLRCLSTLGKVNNLSNLQNLQELRLYNKDQICKADLVHLPELRLVRFGFPVKILPKSLS